MHGGLRRKSGTVYKARCTKKNFHPFRLQNSQETPFFTPNRSEHKGGMPQILLFNNPPYIGSEKKTTLASPQSTPTNSTSKPLPFFFPAFVWYLLFEVLEGRGYIVWEVASNLGRISKKMLFLFGDSIVNTPFPAMSLFFFATLVAYSIILPNIPPPRRK